MIEVRLATFSDSKDIFEWRNDSHTRQMLHNSKLVKWNEHESWFEETLGNCNRCLLICVDKKDEKVGVVRFDISDNSAELSINLSPQKHGKGLAKLCLNAAIQYFKSYFPKHKKLKAEIKKINRASQKSFEGIGFEFEKEVDGVRHYTLIL